MLGLAPDAPSSLARDAHRRLSARVAPSAGGTEALAQLVDEALHEITRRSGPATRSLDPWWVLGLAVGAAADDVHAAYRRLAPIVHPDRGGTDELFRVVASAVDVLTRPSGRGPRLGGPWPRPRAERPFKPPPESERVHAPGWRDWLEAAGHGSILGLLVALWLVSFSAAFSGRVGLGILGLGGIAAALTASSIQGPRATRGLVRAVVRATGGYRGSAGAAAEDFLAQCCLDSPVHREREDVLYDAYSRWCGGRGARQMSRYSFIEKLRTLGLLHVQSPSLENALFIGVRLRDAASA